MRLTPDHQRDGKNDFFGLIPGYFVYASGAETARGSIESDPEKRNTRAELFSAKEGLVTSAELNKEETGKNLEATKAQIQEMFDRYNDKYAKPFVHSMEKPVDWVGKKVFRRDVTLGDKYPYFEKIEPDFENPNNTIAQIDRILTTPFWHKNDKEWGRIIASDPRKNPQSDALIELRNTLTENNDLYGDMSLDTREFHEFGIDLDSYDFSKRADVETAYKKINEAQEKANDINTKKKLEHLEAKIVLKLRLLKWDPNKDNPKYYEAKTEVSEAERKLALAHTNKLEGAMLLTRRDEETLKAWKAKPAYIEMERAFDAATVMPFFGNDESFKRFWTTEGGYSQAKLEQTKALFFAALAEETNGFEDEMVMGVKFGNNEIENKKNFPFIYNEWLKYNTKDNFDSHLENYQQEVNRLESEVQQGSSVEAIMQNDNYKKAVSAEYKAWSSLQNRGQSGKEWEAEIQRWQDEGDILYKAAQQLERFAGNTDENDEDRKKAKQAAQQLRAHEALADARVSLAKQEKMAGISDQRFTRKNFTRLENHKQILMEFCMRKFMKAMQIVDNPFRRGDWTTHYNPTVRRLLIADIYRNGVGDWDKDPKTGKETFVENIDEDHYWMLSKLVQSPYFDRTEKGENLSDQQRDVLVLARIANMVAIELEYNRMASDVVERVIELQDNNTKAARKEEIEAELSLYPEPLVEKAKQTPIETLKNKDRKTIAETKELYVNFLNQTEAAIADPFSKASTEFVEEILKGGGVKTIENREWSTLKGGDLEKLSKDIHRVEHNFNTLELEDASTADVLKRMGIEIDGAPEAYQEYIKDKPYLVVDNWDNLFHPDHTEEFDELVKMFEFIIPPNEIGGKENFIAGLRTLRGKGDITNWEVSGEGRDNQAGVIETYRMIKGHIMAAREIGNRENIKAEEINEQLKGVHIGDRVSGYLKKIWNMAAGPGQSWANRGAGIIMMLGLLKMARKAWKGDDKYGKLFRGLFIAGAAEITLKNITGRGALDRLGLDSIAGSIEGTHEAVLVQKGEKYMDSLERPISVEEHAGALFELKDVPFHKVMEWYKAKQRNEKDLKLPDGINVNNIVRSKVTWHKMNKDARAQEILFHTVKNFFNLVGEKDKVHAASGQDILEEKWITILKKDNNYHPRYADSLHRDWVKGTYAGNPDKLTWDLVMKAEIDEDDVPKTMNQTIVARVAATAGEMIDDFSNWTRQEIAMKFRDKSAELWATLGEKTDEVVDFLEEAKNEGVRKLYFGKESVKFWYGAHQYEIKSFLANHWEIVKEGAKLPFEIIYAADQAVLPYATKTLRQARAIFQRAEYSEIQNDLTAGDIMENPNIDILSEDNKTGFTHFGFFQRSFYDALNSAERDDKGKLVNAFHETTEPATDSKEISEYLEPPHIGYLITETTPDDVHSNDNDPNLWNKMQEQAHKDARRYFHGEKDIPSDMIERFMYPIHTVKKTGDPPKLYTFWRMPLKNSTEYHLKQEGRWADYENPNLLKHRPPFMVDPNKNFMENMEDAFIKSMDPDVRVAYNSVTKYAIQLPYMSLGMIERMGKIAGFFASIPFTKDSKERGKWVEDMTSMEEGNKQMLDEMFAGASDRGLSRSTFYSKHPDNVAMYKTILQYCQQYRKEFYLGLFEGKNGHESTKYTGEAPSDWSYAKFQKWYDMQIENKKIKPNKTWDSVLKTKVKEEAKGQ